MKSVPQERGDPRLIAPLLGEGDALIIVPPFIHCQGPSLAAHLLQACAAEAGFQVAVFYASLSLRSELGPAAYDGIGVDSCVPELMGERFFAAAAHGLPPLGFRTEGLRRYCENADGTNPPLAVTWPELRRLASAASQWADAMAEPIARRGYRVVGCTAVAQQTNASVALLNRVKRLAPETVTIIGGANCMRDMARGMASLSPALDYVFSGEGERSFPRFLEQVRSGRPPSERVIVGSPCLELDSLPATRFTEFFEQLRYFAPEAKADEMWLPYQSSRGCWWGQKHHCTFCGNYLNDRFREKSPQRVLDDLGRLVAETPARRVLFIDHIMPYSYFRTLLPRLASELTDLSFFYEEKANLSLDRVLALKRARVDEIQPGIEALSTSLLQRMNKGVTAGQNIRLLRYARSTRLLCAWNLLFGFPGDQAAEYHDTLALIPMLRHLYPPRGLSRMSLDRFSPYWEQPARYGVRDIRPFPAYADVSPPGADVERLAYHFRADYASASLEDGEIPRRLVAEVGEWRKAWSSANPVLPQLWVNRLGGDLFLLRDTRGLPDTRENQLVGPDQAAAALVGGRRAAEAAREWALAHKVGVMLDGEYVALATATPELLLEFEG
jgi:ribosomal peptide maturation radical SAM protein 1